MSTVAFGEGGSRAERMTEFRSQEAKKKLLVSWLQNSTPAEFEQEAGKPRC
jgi:hypothetical protein